MSENHETTENILSPQSSDKCAESNFEPENKIRRKAKLWLNTGTFDANQLEEFFAAEKWWIKQKVTRTLAGSKSYYYCNHMKKSSCPATIYVHAKNTEVKFDIFHCGEHCHEAKENVRFAASPELIAYVDGLVKSNIKFRSISHLVRNNTQFPEKPTDSQVMTQ